MREPTWLRRAAAVVGRALGYPSFIRIADFWCDAERGEGKLRTFLERMGRKNFPKRAVYRQIRAREKQLKARIKMMKGAELVVGPAKPNVSEVVRCVSVKLQYGAFLYELVRHVQPAGVVEIGTAFGISGMYLGFGLEGNAKGRLYSFDPHPKWHKLGAESLRLATKRATAYPARFEDAWEEAAKSKNAMMDLAYVDGPHTYAAVMAEYELLMRQAGPAPVLVFDDIHWDDQMDRVWSELKSRPEVVCRAEIGGRFGVIEVAPERR